MKNKEKEFYETEAFKELLKALDKIEEELEKPRLKNPKKVAGRSNFFREFLPSVRTNRGLLAFMLGWDSAFILGYVFFFTSLHEWLHALPLMAKGVPYLVTSTQCISYPILDWIAGVYELTCMFPYLFPSLLGLAALLTGIKMRNLPLLAFGSILIINATSLWILHGLYEFLVILV